MDTLVPLQPKTVKTSTKTTVQPAIRPDFKAAVQNATRYETRTDASIHAASVFYPLSESEFNHLLPFVDSCFSGDTDKIERAIARTCAENIIDRCLDEDPDRIIAGLSMDVLDAIVCRRNHLLDRACSLVHHQPAVTLVDDHQTSRHQFPSKYAFITHLIHKMETILQANGRPTREQQIKNNSVRNRLARLDSMSPEDRLDDIVANKDYWSKHKGRLNRAGFSWADVLAHEVEFKARRAHDKLADLLLLSPEKRLDEILGQKNYWVHYQALLAKAGIAWTDVLDHETRARANHARERLTDDILPLTPKKRLNAIIKEQGYWSEYKDMLEKAGIPWSDVTSHKATLKVRKTEAAARAADRATARKAQQEQDLIASIRKNPLKDIGIRSSPKTSGREHPVIIEVDTGIPENLESTRVEPLMLRAIKSLLTGFSVLDTPEHPHIHRDQPGSRSTRQGYRSARQGYSIRFHGKLAAWGRLIKRREIIAKCLDAIRNLDPDHIRTLDSKDAASFCGMTRTVFDDAVIKLPIPVAGTRSFYKWGKTLEIKQFNPRDLLFFRENRKTSFLDTRKQDIADRRKAAAATAKSTRARRQVLTRQISNQDYAASRDLVLKTGDLRAGLYLELFRCAQRGLRLAVSSRSRPTKKAAMHLKEDALACLHRNKALDIFYLPGESETDFGYILSLKGCPSIGSLPMSCSAGQKAKFPDRKNISVVDYNSLHIDNRKFTRDESAIHTLENIRSEIERLVVVLDGKLVD